MIDLGMVRPGQTLRIPFSTFDKDDGSSITMTSYAAADILVYKDGGTTERASTAGYTATTDFDAKTGKHVAVIDLADNTTAGFFAAGSEYIVAIDAVTVDAVTTGGWIARFTIGYPDAVLNTTIATLSTQTSFTLTDGPAENDALNGMWLIVHDVASRVQWALGLVDDYVGSTKTVTLAAAPTFTIAASDNIAVMGPAPLQPSVTGRKVDASVDGDVEANVTKVAGTAQTPGDIIVDTSTIIGRLPTSLLGGLMRSQVMGVETDAISAAAVSAGAANKVADHTLRRTYANARASSDGDTVGFRSLLGAIAKLVNKWTISGATLTVTHEDDTTTVGTQTVTGTAGADPITQLDTD